MHKPGVCGCITLQGQCDVLPFWPWHWQCPLSLRMQEMGKGPVQTIRTVSEDDGEVMGLHLPVSSQIFLKSMQIVCLFLR